MIKSTSGRGKSARSNSQISEIQQDNLLEQYENEFREEERKKAGSDPHRTVQSLLMLQKVVRDTEENDDDYDDDEENFD